MHLAKLYSQFDSRCRSIDKRANYILSNKINISPWEFNYLTTTLISSTWQNWSAFCRLLIVYSCQGAKARDSLKIAPRVSNNSFERVAYEASLAKRMQTSKAKTNGHINFPMRNEPTWGDTTEITKIIVALRPSNMNTLLNIFGRSSTLKHLQLLRNACAHKNSETLLSLKRLSLNYNFSKLEHPSELAWATLKNSTDIAIFYWLYEMNLIADYATSTN